MPLLPGWSDYGIERPEDRAKAIAVVEGLSGVKVLTYRTLGIFGGTEHKITLTPEQQEFFIGRAKVAAGVAANVNDVRFGIGDRVNHCGERMVRIRAVHPPVAKGFESRGFQEFYGCSRCGDFGPRWHFSGHDR